MYPHPYQKMALIAFGYGVVRKIVRLQDAKVRNYWEIKEEPMLLTHKAFLVGFSGIANIYAWPIFAYKDLVDFERSVRGMKLTERPYKDMIDYMLD